MKKTFLCLGFLLSTIVVTFAQYHKNTVLYNYAPSGLRLRAFPNSNAEVLATVPYGDKVRFTWNDDGETGEIEVDGIKSVWQKVIYNDKTGYVFAGYLSQFPIPAVGTKDLVTYLEKEFKHIGKKQGGMSESGGEDYYSDSTQCYIRGTQVVVYQDEGYDEAYAQTTIFNNATFNEIYLLVKKIYQKEIDEYLAQMKQEGSTIENPDHYQKPIMKDNAWRIDISTGCEDWLTISFTSMVVVVSKGGGC